MTAELAPVEHWTTSELICWVWVDTDTADLEPQVGAMLAARGYSRKVIATLRRLASLGLWWNVIWWDWCSLDIFDVLLGYAMNTLCLALLSWPLFGWRCAVFFGALAAVLAVVGSLISRLERRRLLRSFET